MDQAVRDRSRLVVAMVLAPLVMSLVAVVLTAAMFVPLGGPLALFVI